MKTQEKIKVKANILQQIAKASDAIRRKHQLVKVARDVTENAMNEMLKPVVMPLQQLVNNSKKSNSKEKIIKSDEFNGAETFETADNTMFEKDDDSVSKSIEESQIEDNVSKTTMDGGNDDTNRSADESFDLAAAVVTSTPSKPTINNSLSTLLKQLNSKNPNLDKTNGIRKLRGNRFYIGDSEVIFDKDTIKIAAREYQSTPGLLELMFKKKPNEQIITDSDKKIYGSIVKYTNVGRKKYNPHNELRTDRSEKYKKYVAKYVGSAKTGRGLPRYMISQQKNIPIEYIHWDDPNELVARLRLLMASQFAGNPSHNNEIMSIIEELREANIIE